MDLYCSSNWCGSNQVLSELAMKTEITLSTMIAIVSAIKVSTILGQLEFPAGSIAGMITQFGGLGLAVWLAYHHTTVVIPNLQKSHREERKEDLLMFKEALKEKEESMSHHCKFERPLEGTQAHQQSR